MKLSFDVCAFVALIVLVGAVAIADQAVDDRQAGRTRELHKELAGTRETSIVDAGKPITFHVTANNPAILLMAKSCTGGGTNDISLIVNAVNGQPIVTINECTGKVIVAHPDRMNEQAREFWRVIQLTWPQVCAPRPEK